VWTCETCGAVHDRDHLAAQNILKFGLQKQNIIKATGGTSGRCFWTCGVAMPADEGRTMPFVEFKKPNK